MKNTITNPTLVSIAQGRMVLIRDAEGRTFTGKVLGKNLTTVKVLLFTATGDIVRMSVPLNQIVSVEAFDTAFMSEADFDPANYFAGGSPVPNYFN